MNAHTDTPDAAEITRGVNGCTLPTCTVAAAHGTHAGPHRIDNPECDARTAADPRDCGAGADACASCAAFYGTPAAPVAIEYAHPDDIGRTSGMGDPITCYHANAAAAAAQGKGIPRYTGAGCDREHVEIHTPLTYPAAVSARYAGDAYAAYIQRDLARKLAQGLDRTGESLCALFVGNDGE